MLARYLAFALPVLWSAPVVAQLAPLAMPATTADDHPAPAPPAVDAAAVAKALLDLGPVGFVPGNIRVFAEAGTKATQILTRLHEKSHGRAYLVLCARGTDLAALHGDLAQRLNLTGRDVLVMSTAVAWTIDAPAANPAMLRELEQTAVAATSAPFDRLEALCTALPAALDGAMPLATAPTPAVAAPTACADRPSTATGPWFAYGVGAGAAAMLVGFALGFAVARRSRQ